jgi:hypothetical protein
VFAKAPTTSVTATAFAESVLMTAVRAVVAAATGNIATDRLATCKDFI